jgi:phosphinothricin acetyltransferase
MNLVDKNGVEIRPATRADIPAITALYNHYVRETVITFDIEPTTLEARLQWFEQFAPEGPYRLFVARAGGVFAGYAGTLKFRAKEAYRTSVETTIYLEPRFQSRGLGRALYETLFDALKDTGVHRAYGGITLPNPGSLALHEKAGFRHIGTYSEVGFKHGQYWDVAWYERAVEAPGRGTKQKA